MIYCDTCEQNVRISEDGYCLSCGKHMDNNRVIAMEWWNNLSSAQKTQICDTNTELAGSPRKWESLTGREIQKLYTKR
jgi:hypothetical protein